MLRTVRTQSARRQALASTKANGILQHHRALVQRNVSTLRKKAVAIRCSSQIEEQQVNAKEQDNTEAQETNAVHSAEDQGAKATKAHTFQKPSPKFSPVSIAKLRTKQFTSQVKRMQFPIGSKTIYLGLLFGTWYISNVYFNVYNKRVLNAFPYPVMCTAIHLLVASSTMIIMWAIRMKKKPKVSTSTYLQVLPLGLLHMLGFLLTNASLGSVAVSFTHTIKALEPFFTAAFSAWLLGTMPSFLSMMALVPIVSGVIVASFTEASFTWAGLLFALGSNFAFQLRNVLSKQYMGTSSYESLEGSSYDSLDQVNLFAYISLTATLLMLPCVYYLDVTQIAEVIKVQGFGGVATKPLPQLIWWSIAAGLCRTADVLVSYAILARVSPVTHSVGNCMKRVIVIAASIFIFQNPVSSKNLLGTMMAISGVFLYSMTKKMDKMNKLPIDSLVRKFSVALSRKLKRKKASKDSDKEDDEKSDLEYYL